MLLLPPCMSLSGGDGRLHEWINTYDLGNAPALALVACRHQAEFYAVNISHLTYKSLHL